MEAESFQQATEQHRSGNKASALKQCEQMLASGPSIRALPAVLNLKAVILAEMGCLLAAADCIRQALDSSPNIAALYDHLARVQAALGLPEAALSAAETACQLAPEKIEYRYQLARLLRLANEPAGATREALACLAMQAHFDEARILLSELATEQGDSQRAVGFLRAVVAHDPDHVRAWAMLSDCDQTLVGELAVEEALARLAASGNDTDSMARANFALAYRANRAGAPTKAFDLFCFANQLRSCLEPFDIAAWEDRVAGILAATNGVCTTNPSPTSNDLAMGDQTGRRLIFVVGMPRSGTTLCEQVLSTHAEVYGAGELPGMEQLRNELQRLSLEADVPSLSPQVRQTMRDHYLHLLPHKSNRHARVIDKAPRNFERIELILHLFPAARIIWMLRHPLDTVLSCFEQDFGPGQAFSNRLDHAARMYVGHARLLHSALQRHGDSILVVDYARLVTHLESTAGQMANFIGISFDPAMLRPELNPRRVRTASSEQVRRPVYTLSIDRWRQLGDKLAPASAILKDAGLIDATGTSRMTSWLAAHPATPSEN